MLSRSSGAAAELSLPSELATYRILSRYHPGCPSGCWQLFMGDIIAKRIRTGNPIVFIYLPPGTMADSLYWATRERGALESTRVALGWQLPIRPVINARQHVAPTPIRDAACQHVVLLSSFGDGRRNGPVRRPLTKPAETAQYADSAISPWMEAPPTQLGRPSKPWAS